MGIQINGNTDIISPDDGSLTIEGTTNFSALQVNSQNLPSAGPLSNRNLIINGAMTVAQRATQVTSVTSSGYRTVDRFKLNITSLGTWTVDQATDGPAGFTKSFKATCTTADASPAASDSILFVYQPEAQNLQLLDFGASGAKDTTLSFWVKSNKTGTATVAVLQLDNSNKMVSFEYSISSADTWEQKTITIPGDTAGVINDDNGAGLQFEWWLNSGSNYQGGSHRATWTTFTQADRNPSNLGVGGATSDYWQITGVQLEVGSVATPFEHRSYGDELARCQRYYQLMTNFPTSFNAPGTSESGFFSYQFKVAMRQAPTVTVTNTGTTSRLSSLNVSATDIDSVAFQAVSSSSGMVYMYGTTEANASAEI